MYEQSHQPTHIDEIAQQRPLSFTRLFFWFALQLLVITALSLTLSGSWRGQQEQLLHPSLTIAGLPFGNLSPEEAEKRLNRLLEKDSAETTITFHADEQQVVMEREKLHIQVDAKATIQAAVEATDGAVGIAKWWNEWMGRTPPLNIPLVIHYDESVLTNLVEELAEEMKQPARSATASVTGESISVQPHQTGYRVQVMQTTELLKEKLITSYPSQPLEVPVSVIREEPDVKTEDFGGIDTMLAEQVTQIDPSIRQRLHNAVEAAKRLDGTLIAAQSEFSFYEKTGPYTTGEGYAPVRLLEDDEIQDGLSGGVTQVASSLYTAALQSRASILERHNNKRPVTFLPEGWEAFVNGDGFDLRLYNPSSKPIYIHAAVTHNQLRVAIFGARSDQPKLTLTNGEKQVLAPDILLRPDRTLAALQEKMVQVGKPGLRVKVYATHLAGNGTWVKTLVSDNYYPPVHQIVAVGSSNGQNELGSTGYGDSTIQPGTTDPGQTGVDLGTGEWPSTGSAESNGSTAPDTQGSTGSPHTNGSTGSTGTSNSTTSPVSRPSTNSGNPSTPSKGTHPPIGSQDDSGVIFLN
ncbi:VanW family protein [Brevibacillus dissolubilis]|uniref:VanW family protein n=1 Tax=Brevibacillus dissolubilis TaxID=1844116 RepID=UPI001117A986|nr:VanW family protein [Brevibacillus dissolubilis]